MKVKKPLLLGSALVLFFVFAAQAASAQTTYTLSVSAGSTYSGTATITVYGKVTPAPGPDTGVTLKIINPSGSTVAVGEANVNGNNGTYSYTFVSGGSAGWVAGTYKVNATWGGFPPQIYAQTTFTYNTAVTTTTSTSSTSTSITTTTPTTVTTISTTTTTSTAVSTTTSSTSTTGGGGIPAFPFEGVVTMLFVALVLSAYLVVRRSATRVAPSL